MEQWASSKLRKEYVKAVYCHPVYFTYLTCVQSTSWKMPGWMTHKLESRLLREISTSSDMQMIPLKLKRNWIACWWRWKRTLPQGCSWLFLPSLLSPLSLIMAFPGGPADKEPACQCRRHGFHLWVRKIPWSRKRQSTLVLLPWKSHGQRRLAGHRS